MPLCGAQASNPNMPIDANKKHRHQFRPTMQSHTPGKRRRSNTQKPQSPTSVAAAKAPPDDTWLFGIGQYVNPNAVAALDLNPEETRAAVLLGFRLDFRGPTGKACAVAAPGESLHGVLLRMSTSNMCRVDVLEQGYDRIAATARTYRGNTVQCTVFVLGERSVMRLFSGQEDGTSDQPPDERYLDVIVEGLLHHGVKEEAVETVRNQPYLPRRETSEYVEFPFLDADRLTAISPEVVRNSDGQSGRPLYRVLGGTKVLQWVGPKDCPAFHEMQERRGVDMLVFIARRFYEPLHKMPICLEDFSSDKRAYYEDLFARSFDSRSWRVVGVLATLQ